MNRLPKYMLILFIILNVLGGTILGLFEYSKEKEAKQAFESFYSGDAQVMGAYDKKGGTLRRYEVSIAGILILITASGIIYSLIKRESLKKK